jgi:hypothetical protein
MSKKKALLLLLTFAMIFAFQPTSLADNIQEHAYAYYGTWNYGGYYYFTIEDLDGNWSSSEPWHFALHSMWVVTDTEGSWIELGFMDGGLDTDDDDVYETDEYHHGFYTARGVRDSSGNLLDYKEFKIATSLDTSIGKSYGARVYNIADSSDWDVVIGSTKYGTYRNVSVLAYDIQVGIETNNDFSSSDTWNERYLRRLRSGSWEYWDQGSLYDSQYDRVTVEWKQKYNSINTSLPSGGI